MIVVIIVVLLLLIVVVVLVVVIIIMKMLGFLYVLFVWNEDLYLELCFFLWLFSFYYEYSLVVFVV